jgi:hypothetical protein
MAQITGRPNVLPDPDEDVDAFVARVAAMPGHVLRAVSRTAMPAGRCSTCCFGAIGCRLRWRIGSWLATPLSANRRAQHTGTPCHPARRRVACGGTTLPQRRQPARGGGRLPTSSRTTPDCTWITEPGGSRSMTCVCCVVRTPRCPARQCPTPRGSDRRCGSAGSTRRSAGPASPKATGRTFAAFPSRRRLWWC